MSFQTNTTISLIASVLMFLTKNTFCSSTQRTNTQNYSDLQNSSEDNQDSEDVSWGDFLEDITFSRIKERNEEYKKTLKNIEKKNYDNEIEKLDYETMLTLGKDAFQLKKDFTKKKYEKFLKHVDDFIEVFKNNQSKYSSVLED